jgi:hypothetical protein
VGLAKTVEPVVDDKVALAEPLGDRLHEYVTPPDAVKTARSPEQMVALLTEMDAPAFKLTVTLLLAVQPVAGCVTVTV